ncbi:phage regulatory CII family protein [Plasticicumulans acidivorans]|uniref:Phage regulatory protein CII n=1 Tax=Plasticicumulans acidivorans TaxID=886464 RepID=A0A317N0I8_9GAMM|nr:phage regulatory CII family protein [Plasticicumulans acidivorans]PWV66015.1 hypothetical protein C7443_101503 [Plasticicumulans acidivorans]
MDPHHDIQRAVYDTVHQYPAGVARLAEQMGRSAAVMYAKASGGGRNEMTVADLDALISITGDSRVLEVLAARHGLALRPAELHEPGCPLTAAADLAVQVGRVATEIVDALKDGRITPAESGAIQLILDELVASAHAARNATQPTQPTPAPALRSVRAGEAR